MMGIQKRVGEVRRQDEAFTIRVLEEIQIQLEVEWNQSEEKDKAGRRRIAELGTWFIVGFCCGMRGEEMLLLELAGTRNSLDAMLGNKEYFKIVLSGRTKGNQISGSKFSFPCVNVTSGTGLTPGIWMKRLVEIRMQETDNSGRIFFRGTIPARLSQYEPDFYDVLFKVQANSDAISNQVEIPDTYGIMRSSRRGATAHARNMKVGKDVIEAVHRWRKEAFGGAGVSLRLDLIDVYTSLDALSPTLLEYPNAF